MKNFAVFLFLCFLCFGEGLRFLKLKEGGSGVIRCPTNQVILIRTASYGAVRSPTSLCNSPLSFTEVSSKCNSLRSCRLFASNSIFGDPCRGTKKLLTTAYSCISKRIFTRKSIIICEHQRAKITCPLGSRVAVFYASYGRSSRFVCPSRALKTTRCHSRRSLRIVSRRCRKTRSCLLFASNKVFGDPCPGTFKYLEVRYRCKALIRRKTTRRRSVVIKEHRFGVLRCPRGGRISISTASYGRYRCRRSRAFQVAAVQSDAKVSSRVCYGQVITCLEILAKGRERFYPYCTNATFSDVEGI